MEVRQGDIYFVDLGEPKGSEPGGFHHVVIVQSDTMNRTNIRTVVGCVLTSNLRRGRVPGNITLSYGDGGLPQKSVVNISQVVTLDKRDLVEKTGALDGFRVDEILKNINRMLLRGKRPWLSCPLLSFLFRPVFHFLLKDLSRVSQLDPRSS